MTNPDDDADAFDIGVTQDDISLRGDSTQPPPPKKLL
jgi:hypothetical protein